ncbi:MAG TPA: hypothetical protein VNT26_02130, partial [Candidatus Sulfotelmatobacter sp.]|nr:hypothetical protein [Candidatus Sulfotelmatobacter sp.]
LHLIPEPWEAALTGTLEVCLHNHVEVAILGCRSTLHPAACSVGRPNPFRAFEPGRLEAALTGRLEAYLHKEAAAKPVG